MHLSHHRYSGIAVPPDVTESTPSQKHLSICPDFNPVIDLAVAGVLLVFAGLVVITISLLTSAKSAEVKGAGVVLIGPIPIAFGSDAKWVSLALVLAIVLIVLSFGLNMV